MYARVYIHANHVRAESMYMSTKSISIDVNTRGWLGGFTEPWGLDGRKQCRKGSKLPIHGLRFRAEHFELRASAIAVELR